MPGAFGYAVLTRLAWQLLLALPLAPSPQQAQPAIGFVLGLRGPWQVSGRSLQQGQALLPGSTILLAAGADLSEKLYIDVVLLDNQVLRCKSAEACPAGLAIPQSLNAHSSMLSRFSDAFKLIFERRERYVGLMSRGGIGRPALPNGVAVVEAGRVDLAPFLQGLAAGPYALQLVPVTAGAPAAPQRFDLAVAWDRTSASARLPTDLVPGLYRAILAGGAGEHRVQGEAWILVASAARYEEARAAYEGAVGVTHAWGGSVPEEDIETFLHACLAELAAQAR
jgi:hypothetical protein